jgi:hypothetical protein
MLARGSMSDNKPIDFKYPAERKRWLEVYELALERAAGLEHDSTLGAASLATSDMEIRRRVLIPHKDAPSYAEMADGAEQVALDDDGTRRWRGGTLYDPLGARQGQAGDTRVFARQKGVSARLRRPGAEDVPGLTSPT